MLGCIATLKEACTRIDSAVDMDLGSSVSHRRKSGQ